MNVLFALVVVVGFFGVLGLLCALSLIASVNRALQQLGDWLWS